MILTSQALTLAIILGLGFYTFKYHPLQINVKSLSVTSFLVLLSVVLSIVSLMIPIFGFPALRIGLGQLPLMLVGLLFGPSYAFLAGLSADVIELLSGTIAFPFLGFTLNKILVAMLPALARILLKRIKFNPMKLAYALMSVVFLLALIYVAWVQHIQVGDVRLVPSSMERIIVGLGLLSLYGMMWGLIRRLHQMHQSHEVAIWIVGILLVEIIVQLLLTPIWLHVMYGLPILLSVSVRLIKAGLMVFVHGVLGFAILRVLRRYKFN